MMSSRSCNVLKLIHFSKIGVTAPNCVNYVRLSSSTPRLISPEPTKPRFVYLKVISAVSIGLFIGANISKSVANFLEENELFVPSDDDEDD